MHLQQPVKNVFTQLHDILLQLSNEEYTKPSDLLFKATIGQHVRHIIELFVCLQSGHAAGVVNYEKRKRDVRIETDADFARQQLLDIFRSLHTENKALKLEGNYDEHSEEYVIIETNYFREIVYNLEHTIHHMALMRIGINEVSTIPVPEGFGVASSTIKYKKACAQ